MQIAALQQVISACEEVLVDLDAATEVDAGDLPAEHNVYISAIYNGSPL